MKVEEEGAWHENKNMCKWSVAEGEKTASDGGRGWEWTVRWTGGNLYH